MVLELDHCTPDDLVLSVIRFLIVVEVAKAGTNLCDPIVVVVLGAIVILVKLGVKTHQPLVVLQHPNLLSSQVSADNRLDLNQAG